MDNSIFETERHYCQRFVFVTAWVFEALHYPTLLNEIKKTKLEFYNSPAAGINILCVPSMCEGIERYRIIPEGVSPLEAS